ncbi:hypothetical protein [Erythrobacter phage vB_EliS-L02]|nr:hypothetical protein [Erythrobacter phage vB_EliS-L02]
MFISIEKQIARATLEALTKAGIPYSIDYHRGYEPSGVTSDDPIEKQVEELFACDEGWIMTGTTDEEGPYDAFVYFIWGNGNDGRDCISDYSTSLEHIIDPISEAAQKA